MNLHPDDVNIVDIAHSLAMQCRFTGHTKVFYSVAQHSVLVSKLLERRGCDHATVLWGLMHDAAEAYLVGDVATPVKKSLLVRRAFVHVDNVRGEQGPLVVRQTRIR